MAGEGRHRGGRWIVLAILVLIVVLPIYGLVNGTSVVVVTNAAGADANVTVFLGPQPIGAGRIAKGGSAWYIFIPHTADRFTIGCRVDSLAGLRTVRAGRAAATARIYRITVGPCGRITHYSESAPF